MSVCGFLNVGKPIKNRRQSAFPPPVDREHVPAVDQYAFLLFFIPCHGQAEDMPVKMLVVPSFLYLLLIQSD